MDTMTILFGSPEAAAILAKDKELQRIEQEDEIKGDANQLASRLEQIESEIEDLKMEIGCLVDERDMIQAKLREMGPPAPKVGFVALARWNEWVKGKGSGIWVPAHHQQDVDVWSKQVQEIHS
jgi:hypothetical protein